MNRDVSSALDKTWPMEIGDIREPKVCILSPLSPMWTNAAYGSSL